jgi:hypothetical protein
VLIEREEIHFDIVKEETIEVNKKERVIDDEKAKKKKVLNQREGGLESIQRQLSSWSLSWYSVLPALFTFTLLIMAPLLSFSYCEPRVSSRNLAALDQAVGN